MWKELKPASEKVKDEALAASALLRSQIDLKKKTSVVSTTMRSMVSQDRRRFQVCMLCLVCMKTFEAQPSICVVDVFDHAQ